MKLTPWFHPDVKPVHVGFYHTGKASECPIGNKESESDYNWYWDGNYWIARDECSPTYTQNRYWRGLAEKP